MESVNNKGPTYKQLNRKKAISSGLLHLFIVLFVIALSCCIIGYFVVGANNIDIDFIRFKEVVNNKSGLFENPFDVFREFYKDFKSFKNAFQSYDWSGWFGSLADSGSFWDSLRAIGSLFLNLFKLLYYFLIGVVLSPVKLVVNLLWSIIYDIQLMFEFIFALFGATF